MLSTDGVSNTASGGSEIRLRHPFDTPALRESNYRDGPCDGFGTTADSEQDGRLLAPPAVAGIHYIPESMFRAQVH